MVPLDTIQWLHFEGRNVDNLIRMVLWMNEQSWRSNITISVEFEKPDRSTLEPLYDKVDVLFFSKPWAKARGAHSAYDFLHSMADRCKARAIAFCTWGSSPAAVMTKEDGNVKVSTIPVEQATEILDSVGAGDTFNAGVIHGLITGRDAREAAAFGCHLATRKVQQHGFSGLVNPDRTDNFVHPPLSNDYESLSCATGHTRRSSHHAH
ncbi:hypothetical protein BZG36_05382 [Bifiguratus adelaidae]|uniref:Carbohydrate kinase PfkB domain-containing protein n=1 Tax=Bifiguratus adelaidae TaxID=1938954 RepID=A0A261XTC7_9FUNG|nr:hypothetical protein BZG36_05382 [Bifiguratus adelaidae]